MMRIHMRVCVGSDNAAWGDFLRQSTIAKFMEQWNVILLLRPLDRHQTAATPITQDQRSESQVNLKQYDTKKNTKESEKQTI